MRVTQDFTLSAVIFSLASFVLIFSIVNEVDIFKDNDLSIEYYVDSSSESFDLVILSDNNPITYTITHFNGTNEVFIEKSTEMKQRQYIDVKVCRNETRNISVKVCSVLGECESKNYILPKISGFDCSFMNFDDSDFDGIQNALDNCPTVFNLNQEDSDGDGVGDACDNCVDISNTNQDNPDGDLWGTACDNCPSVANDFQTDWNLNGIGDACPGEAFPDTHDTLHLWRGDNSSEFPNNGKYDLLFIVENKTLDEIDELLNEIFYTNDFALTKTNPFYEFKDNLTSDYMNIYFYSLSKLQDYSLDPYGINCIDRALSGITGIPDQSDIYNETRFELIASSYNFIDNSVYITEDPKIWPHVKLLTQVIGSDGAGGRVVNVLDSGAMYLSRSCINSYKGKLASLGKYDNSFDEMFSSIFVHENGHQFSYLSDEYTKAGYVLIPKNCAISTADASSRWGSILGLPFTAYSGCGLPGGFRAINNSIMNNQIKFNSSEWLEAFGSLNQYYINEDIQNISINY